MYKEKEKLHKYWRNKNILCYTMLLLNLKKLCFLVLDNKDWIVSNLLPPNFMAFFHLCKYFGISDFCFYFYFGLLMLHKNNTPFYKLFFIISWECNIRIYRNVCPWKIVYLYKSDYTHVYPTCMHICVTVSHFSTLFLEVMAQHSGIRPTPKAN